MSSSRMIVVSEGNETSLTMPATSSSSWEVIPAKRGTFCRKAIRSTGIIRALTHAVEAVSSALLWGPGFAFPMGQFYGTPSHVDNHHRRAKAEHRESQFLTSGEWSDIETDLHIRLTYKLDQEPEQPVKRQKRPKDGAPIKILFVDPSQNEKQDQPFEKGFIDLRRMPRHIPAFREHHAPRDVCGTAEQFTIYEVA